MNTLAFLNLAYGLFELLGLIVLIIIGLIIIVFIVKLLLIFVPAAIVALVVWFLTGGSLWWAGIAFVVVAIIAIARRL